MPPLTKTDLLPRLADFVLSEGLAKASLRPLAKAAGTSDRMLIYHFGSKDALISDLLHHLANQMATGLTQALPPTRATSEGACLAEIVALLREPALRPFMRLWLDILSGAAQGDAVFAATARDILNGYITWIMSRLPEHIDEPELRAAEMLALLEGIIVLEMAGMPDAVDAAIARHYPL